ncbi:MAG: HAD family hydrolase [Candidatus Omnitrophica bacterium]|nr:HAD family hydrolase [Candidatus Omnitrophota bacterium]MDD5553383.1 HAD family hydrolase [Candidatus Omnitrophota bacterium]
MKLIKVVFLDRDGVINKYPGDRDYVKSWSEFSFLPGAKESLKRLNGGGYKLIIISNQAGVSKGLYSRETLDLITRNMLKELKDSGAVIEGVYYCVHLREDNCACRKPKTGLIDSAVQGLKKKGQEIELSRSFFIGDSIPDAQAGKAAGIKTILLFSGKERPGNRDNWEVFPDYTADDLSSATDLILSLLR